MLRMSAPTAQAVARCLGTVLLLGGGAGPAVAGISAEAQASLSSMRVDLTFYQCVEPPEADCTAAGAEGKKSCPACRSWEAQRLNYRAEPELRLETGPYHERANVFLRDATESIYGLHYPTVDGRPVRVRDLYQTPEKFGWTEVPPESAGPGTMITFRSSLGGIIVYGNNADSPSQLDVVFPSEQAGGALRQDSLADLTKWVGKPKFLVPIALAESAAAARAEMQAIVVRSSGTRLDGAARTRLEQLAGVLKTTGAEVSLAGYDATVENPAQSLASAEQLAVQAREYLVASGVAPSQVHTLSSPEPPPQAAQRVLVTSVTFQPGGYWNTWTEQVAPEAEPALDQDHSQELGYQRVRYLQPNTKYLVALQLSGFPYDFGESTWSLQSRPAGGDFEKALDDALAKRLKSPWKLRAVVFPGPLLRNEPALIQQPLEVKLEKIVSFRKLQQFQPPDDPFQQLAADPGQAYAFGTIAFAVETGPDTGSTSLGISLWDEATNRPLDSITVPLCVGETSPCEKRVPYLGLDGPGLIDVGTGAPPEGLPDGSLHIFEMSGRIVGVFHRRDLPSEYPAWVISKDPGELKNSLKSILSKFGKGEDPIQRGKDLAGQLFPQKDDRQKKARAAFQSFLESRGAASPFPEQPPARLFVRMLLKSEGEQGDSVMFPIGLLHPGDKADDGFVGYHFRIEAPLPRQSYQSLDHCIANWLVVVPPSVTTQGDSELKEGRSALEKRLQSLDKFMLANSQMDAYEDFPSFLRRLDEAARRGGDSTAIVVLSHHGDRDLILNEKDNLGPESLEALPGQPFSAPSMAILGSCSALTYGADQMVKVLNAQGVGTVIASNNQVSGRLAGNFLECLAGVVEGSPAPEITASDLFYQAQRCLWEQKKEAGSEQSLFGPQVLSFSLVGNPSLALCSQRKGS